MRVLLATLALAVVSSGTPAGQAAPSAVDLARQLQTRYTGVKDFKAEFTNTYKGGSVFSKTSEERGEVLVKKPGRMRWTYTDPEKKELVANGTNIFFYVVADKQVTVNPLPAANEASTSFLFLLGRGDLVRDFTPTLAAAQPAAGEWHLALAPRSPQADFSSLTVMVDRKSLTILGFVTTDSTGGANTVRFSRVRENVGLPDSAFDFKIPRGAEIIK